MSTIKGMLWPPFHPPLSENENLRKSNPRSKLVCVCVLGLEMPLCACEEEEKAIMEARVGTGGFFWSEHGSMVGLITREICSIILPNHF